MLDTAAFIVTFIVVLSLVAGVSALVITTVVTRDKVMRSVLINTAAGSAKTGITLVTVVPSSIWAWSWGHIASAILLVVCIAIHIELDDNQANFLNNFQDTYYDVNQVWIHAIATPVGAILGAIYATVVPIWNVVWYVPISAFWGTVKVLGECGDPWALFEAIAKIPLAFYHIVLAWIGVFDTTAGGNWMVNPLAVGDAIKELQAGVAGLTLHADCMCEFFAPTINIISGILTDDAVPQAVEASVNTVWRFIQFPAQMASRKYEFNVTPIFDEIRDACYWIGILLDACLEGFLNIASQQTHIGKHITLPIPSLGMGLMRTISGIVSTVEIPVSIIGAAVGADTDPLSAGNTKKVYVQLHLAVLAVASGINSMRNLVLHGNPGTTGTLMCDYYTYDFYHDHNVRGSVPKECMCTSNSCGHFGHCAPSGMECQCNPGAIHAVIGDALSQCVVSCTERKIGAQYSKGLVCNNAQHRGVQDVPKGVCLPDGCRCASDHHLDRYGTCTLGTETLTEFINRDGCRGVMKPQVGNPIPCTVQVSGLALIGSAYTASNAFRMFWAGDNVFDVMQTVDGMWYSRMDAVNCRYRKLNSKWDRTIDPDSCQCDTPGVPGTPWADDIQGVNYNPWCDMPTLNANVYNHMDAFAYYAGKILPLDLGISVPSGGMGWFPTFLNDNLGVIATNMGRTAVETTRLLSRAVGGVVDYATSAFGSNQRNLLQIPMNCEWGIPYDGKDIRTHYTDILQFEEVKAQAKNMEVSVVSTDLQDAAKAMIAIKPDALGALAAMNRFYRWYKVDQRAQQTGKCIEKSYHHSHSKCYTTNNMTGCTCNIDMPYDDSYGCSCIAWYPGIDIEAEDMHGYYQSETISRFYHQEIPWCNSMFLEWHYYRSMETAVAVNNIFARLDSSHPLDYDLQSPCYENTEATQFTLGDTTSVIKTFQPETKGGNIYRFPGGQTNLNLDNETVCTEMAQWTQPQWIMFDPTRGDDCSDCHGSTGTLKSGYSYFLADQGTLVDREISNTALNGNWIRNGTYGAIIGSEFVPVLNATELIHAEGHQIRTNNIVLAKMAIRGKLPLPTQSSKQGDDWLPYWQSYMAGVNEVPPPPIDTIHVIYDSSNEKSRLNNGYDATIAQLRQDGNISENAFGPMLTDKVYLLHPETCGFAQREDQLIFRPCAHNCHTLGGADICWCNVTIPTDFLCNLGQLFRQASWGTIAHTRRISTAKISVMGGIVQGMNYNTANGICDMSRLIGTACGAMATIFTGQATGKIAADVRHRLATLMFTAADTAFIMPAGAIAGFTSIMGPMGVKGAVIFGEFKHLLQQLSPEAFGEKPQTKVDTGISTGENAVGMVATFAASMFANSYKFGCISTCGNLGGLQKVIFGTGLDGNSESTGKGMNSAEGIIPAVEDFIDLTVALLDELYTEVVVLVAQVIVGFVGMMFVDKPTIGEWLNDALKVIWQLISLFDKEMMTFTTIGIKLLPKSIQPIMLGLITGLCIDIFQTGTWIIDAINLIPGTHVDNTFKTNLEMCLHSSDIMMDLQQQKTQFSGEGHDGFLRRRLLDTDMHSRWQGDTFCARYGRKVLTENITSTTALETGFMEECVGNRNSVQQLRKLTGRDYWEWALMDDWRQPAKFLAETAHGILIYYTQSEAHLMKWGKAGYPVLASMDIVRGIASMGFPTASGLMGAVPTIYPDYKTAGTTGSKLMKIVSAVEHTKFPNLMNQNWAGMNEALYNTGKDLMSITTPSQSEWDARGTEGAGDTGTTSTTTSDNREENAATRRRLVDNAVEHTKVPISSATNECTSEDIVCTHCNVLDAFVNDLLQVCIATGHYYKHNYVPQISYLFDSLAHYQSTYTESNSRPYSVVPQDVQLPYPGAQPNTEFMAQPTPNSTLSTATTVRSMQHHTNWRGAIKQFFTNRGDATVPIFGHSLWWYAQYPLRPCDTLQMAYNNCKTPNYSVEDSLALVMMMVAGMALLGWITGIRLPMMIKVPLLIFAFLIFRYNYVPRCLPVLPVCLASDLEYMIKDIAPVCLCELVPALVMNSDKCTPDNCFNTDNGVVYTNCPSTELGMANPILFTLRWKLPTLFVHLFSSWYSPLTYFKDLPTISAYLLSIAHDRAVDSLQVTCAVLGIFDIILIIFAVQIAISVMPKVTIALTETLVSSWATLAVALPVIFEH